MPIHQSHTRKLSSALAVAGLLACPFDMAQTSVSTSANTDANTAAAWRATSRLGYGPTEATALAARQSPKAWAMGQIDSAYATSQWTPNIPSDIARFNQPLNASAKDFQAQREARKKAKAPTPGGSVMGNDGDAEGFSREMTQTSNAWRLMSCSDPAFENPLLARMTEFWFNHLNFFVGKGTVRPFVGHCVVNVIRANALGKFEDLLLASARHPAMLLYLDQALSNVRGLNGLAFRPHEGKYRTVDRSEEASFP